MKKLVNLNGAKALGKNEQQAIFGGKPPVPECQGGGDPECCGWGPGQCGVGHCSGGMLSGGVCVCF